jgi:hypothetical protein
MADETVTVDTAGVTRTATGEIAEPVRTRSDSTPTQSQEQPKPEVKAEPKAEDDGKSLLNKEVGEKDKEPAKEAAKAPEAYAEFKVPDGFTLDPEVAKRAGGLFKELNLSQDGAQKLIDLYTAETKAAFEAPFNAYQDMRKGWRDAVSSDREMGHRLPEIKTNVTQMLNTHLGPILADQFREAMDLTGVGDHPAFVRAFDLLSQLLVESRSHIAGNRASPFGQTRTAQPLSAAQALYPHLPSRDSV